MDEIKYPIKEPTTMTFLGESSYYIRIPMKLVKTGKFPCKNLQNLIISVESKDRIVITPL